MIRDHVIIEEDVEYGLNFDTGYFVVIRKGVKIGNNVSIWSHCTIDPEAVIGNNVKIHNNNYICQLAVIEDDVFIAPGCTFLNDKYPPRFDKTVWEPPLIKRGARIGGGVTICPGVIVGERAVVGSGSLVVHDIPNDQIWFGNPARRFR